LDSIGIVDFEKYMGGKADEVDEALDAFFRKGPEIPNLSDAARYSMGLDITDRKKRGKRIRPVLCLLACESLGGSAQVAMPMAVASEIMHNFLLVHDDIEDEDRVRRDRPSVWVRYGLAHGINVGDYLFAKTYEAALGCMERGLGEDRMRKLLQLITKTIVHTGEGQALDIGARNRRDITVDEYLHITIEKTGYYLACPAVGGALVAGANEKTLTALEEFGKCIGPVFQITDDVIDLTEGKGRGGVKGSDIMEGKRSYLVVHAASRCTDIEKKQLFEILDNPRDKTTAEHVEWATALFEKYGAVEAARKAGEDFLSKGQSVLAPLPEALRQNVLAASRYMLERKR
jgi:geranylgeranyl diphosphate synthase type I